MIRSLVTLLLIATGSIASAQLVIDGRVAMFDEQTNTLLATVPEDCFNGTVTMSVHTGKDWNSCTIDGKTIEDHFTFDDITANKTFLVSYKNGKGVKNSATLRFTFLPIIQLQGSFGYDYEEGTILLSSPDASLTDTLAATIKWRGGSTNSADKHKRNYKIKLEKNKSLLGMRNDDSWILDAGQADVFRLRNRIAMDLWNDIARPPYYIDKEPAARNGVSGKVVEVFLNNEYRGVYNFSENLDRKQMRLKKVEDGEVHGCLYKSKSWQRTQMFNTFDSYDNHSETLEGFEVKYPDLSDNDTTDWHPLVVANNFAVQSHRAEFEEHVADYFDIDPIIDYSIFLTVTNAVDNGGKNMFWAIYDKRTSQRLTLAPWDLDATFGQRWGGLLKENNGMASPYYLSDVDVKIFYNLYAFNTNQFNDQINQRYNELRQPGNPLSTDNLINRFTQYYHQLKNSGAANRETRKWSGDSDLRGEEIDFDKEYVYICNWIEKRMQIIDRKGFPVVYTPNYFEIGISQPANDQNDQDAASPIYNLSGQHTQQNGRLKPGIYIQKGKKIIIRQ